VFVSDAFFRSIILSGGPYIEAGLYRPIAVHTRTLNTTVWAYLPRMGLSSEPEEGNGSEDKPSSATAPAATGPADTTERPEPSEGAADRAAARNAPAAPAQYITTKVGKFTAENVNFGISNNSFPESRNG
jgi:hypothetical protein